MEEDDDMLRRTEVLAPSGTSKVDKVPYLPSVPRYRAAVKGSSAIGQSRL